MNSSTTCSALLEVLGAQSTGPFSAGNHSLCTLRSLGYVGSYIPSVFEAFMFWHGNTLLENAIQDKAPNCTRLYTTGTLKGYTVQTISKAWLALLQPTKLLHIEKLTAQYILFDDGRNDS